GLEVRDAGSHLEHDARALVAEHARRTGWDRAILRRDVGVAHAARHHLEVHLAGPEIGEADVVAHFEILVQLPENGGLHRRSLLVWGRNCITSAEGWQALAPRPPVEHGSARASSYEEEPPCP